MAIALAAAFSLASGFLLTAAGLPRSHDTVYSWLMKLSLAAGFGLGISSCSFFVARMSGGFHLFAIDIAVLIALLALYVLIRNRFNKSIAAVSPANDFAISRWLQTVLITSFVLAAVAGFYCSVLRMFAHQYGEGWDAFAIWNLHARFLFLGRTHWRDGFNALISWSHPDYPLLLPGSIARFWSYLGQDDRSVPAIIGIVFTFCTVMLLVTSLAQLRGPNTAMLSGLVLLATPFLIEQGVAQYADVPLSFFILAAIVLLHFGFRSCNQSQVRYMRGAGVLAGLSAGFAAWTKNEGLLFLAAIFLAHFFASIARVSGQRQSESLPERKSGPLVPMVAGALPMLVLILWFKYSVAAASDLSSSSSVMLEKLLTPSRYGIIMRWYGKELFRFGEWWPVPLTIILPLFYFVAREKKTGSDPLRRSSIAALAITWAGYFLIYLITPRDLYWHLRFSLNRLFLQLWPATVFLFFCTRARTAHFCLRMSPNPRQNPENCNEIRQFPLTCGQILVITIRSIRTSLGVCGFGRSPASRG